MSDDKVLGSMGISLWWDFWTLSCLHGNLGCLTELMTKNCSAEIHLKQGPFCWRQNLVNPPPPQTHTPMTLSKRFLVFDCTVMRTLNDKAGLFNCGPLKYSFISEELFEIHKNICGYSFGTAAEASKHFMDTKALIRTYKPRSTSNKIRALNLNCGQNYCIIIYGCIS